MEESTSQQAPTLSIYLTWRLGYVEFPPQTYTRKYGGYGYGHILRTIVPMMSTNGIKDTEINHMMIKNPARVLAF